MLKSCLFTLFLLAMLFAVPARTQEQANLEAAKTRAAAALKQAREALGGEAALAAVKSLQVQGDYKVIRGERPTQGNFKIELLMPDKYSRSTTLNMGMMEMTMLQTVTVKPTKVGQVTSTITNAFATLSGGNYGSTVIRSTKLNPTGKSFTTVLWFDEQGANSDLNLKFFLYHS